MAEEEKETEIQQKKTGIFGTSTNLVNTIVGAGIIGIPFAIRECGLVVGVFLLIFVGILTEKSLRLLIETSLHPKFNGHVIDTYEELMFFPFGSWGRGFVLYMMFVMAYGAMVAYLIIIKDTVPVIIGFDEGYEPCIVLIIASLGIMLPLSMLRDMASLSCTSLLSVSMDIVLVFFLAAFSPIIDTITIEGGFWELLKNNAINSNVFIGLGVISTAMCCQHSSYLIYNSLENNTVPRWGKVTSISLIISTLATIILGLCGYLGFLEETEGDVLNNFPPGSAEANAARALLAITMVFTYPMESFVARHVIVELLYQGDFAEPLNPKCFHINRRHKVTFSLYIFTLIPALIFDDLGPVLSINGCIGASSLSYIGPGMAFLGVYSDEFLDLLCSWLRKRQDPLLEESKEKPSIELPVVNTEGTVYLRKSLSSEKETTSTLYKYHERHNIIFKPCKPLWWYLLGFPLWSMIALFGSVGMKSRINAPNSYSLQIDKDKYPQPSTAQFFVAIVYIVFGILAMFVGLVSNFFVHVAV